MKIISCILLLVLGTYVTKAQNANAIIFSENGEKFTILINEIIQNEKPETNVRVKNLDAPQYKMKIIFEDARLGETSFTLFMEPDMERTFSLSKNSKGKYVMRFIGAVPLTYEPISIATEQEQNLSKLKETTAANKDTLDVEINPNINSAKINNYSAERPAYLPGYKGPIGCEQPVSEQVFTEIKTNVASKSFEETKLSAAKQLLINQCLLTSQVNELAKLFTFEETKLDFAKYAYAYTYDIANYSKINDVFTFESSVEELNEYIKSKR